MRQSDKEFFHMGVLRAFKTFLDNQTPSVSFVHRYFPRLSHGTHFEKHYWELQS